MDRKVKEQYIAMVLDKVWRNYSENIIIQAIVDMSYCTKSSQELVSKKVNNRLAEINSQILAINPHYNENLKKYDVTKVEILDSLTRYEDTLNRYSSIYDEKIQKLLIKRVELESRRIGLLLKDEYLEEKTELRVDTNKTITNKITNALKNIMNKISSKPSKPTEQKQIDVSIYNDAMDVAEYQNTVQKQVEEKLEHVKKHSKENSKEQFKIEEKIKQIVDEIARLNKEKEELIIKAMESTEKWIAIANVRPALHIRVKNFFVARFNTAKVVHNKIIVPFNDLIKNFENSELSEVNIKLLEMDSFKKQIENTKSRIEKDYKKYRDLNLDKVKQADEIVKVG
jgi:hypothetical protein